MKVFGGYHIRPVASWRPQGVLLFCGLFQLPQGFRVIGVLKLMRIGSREKAHQLRVAADHISAACSVRKGQKRRKQSGREQNRSAGASACGGTPDVPGAIDRRKGQCGYRFLPQQGLIPRAEQAAGDILHGRKAQTDRITAERKPVEQYVNAQFTAKGGNVLMTGHHQTAGKDPFCGINGACDHGLTQKVGHELIAPKAPPHARCHDDAAKLAIRGVQIHKEYILPAA